MAIGLRGKRFLNTFAWIAATLALSLAPIPYSPLGNTPFIAVASASFQQDLAQEIGQRITQVPEFQFIREEAKRMGMKAYLFGGTAAGFAHYVNWDLKRESGDKRFQADRFDYDYTNIYRSTQDLDIVIDGPPEKAQELQAKLAQNFPHLQGNKTAWEVRLLRQDMGDKQALLNTPDFLNQHTDSNSTGMIEITEPHAGDPVVRDLRDWDSKDPYFLRDVREGKLHYYFSPKHAQTKFAKEGRNPPIISVIRYLTKAFQYELEIRPEDLAQIKKIIDEFDPKGREMKNDYVRNWLLKKDNGRKLIQNAVNIEYAWNTLENLGLRNKLIAIEDNADTENSLAWWLSKEPLRSKPVGIDPTGKHPTVRQLIEKGSLPKDLTVAHETRSFLAYESITRAHTGDPNVLISRGGMSGEAAAYGNGFYTQIGRNGAVGSGITIRFTVDPNAREGIDFTRAGSFLIFQNKNALKVIPESLKLTPVEYFAFLTRGEEIDVSDRAIFEKLRRKILAAGGTLSDDEYRQIRSLIQESIDQTGINESLIQEWISLPRSAQFSEGLFDSLIKTQLYDVQLSELIFSKPQFSNLKAAHEINESAQLLRKEYNAIYPPNLASTLDHLIQTDKKKALRLASLFLKSKDPNVLLLLSNKLVQNIRHEAFVIKLNQSLNGNVHDRSHFKSIIDSVLTQTYAKNWRAAQANMIAGAIDGEELEIFTKKVLSKPGFSSEAITIEMLHRLWDVTRIIDARHPDTRTPTLNTLIDQTLSQPFAQNWSNAKTEFLKVTLDLKTMNHFIHDVLASPSHYDESLLVEALKKIRQIYSTSARPDITPLLNTIINGILDDQVTKDWRNARFEIVNLINTPHQLDTFIHHAFKDPASLDSETANEVIKKWHSYVKLDDFAKADANFEKLAELIRDKPANEEWDRIRLKILAMKPDHPASLALLKSLEKAHEHDSFTVKLVAEHNLQTDLDLRAMFSKSSLLRDAPHWLEEFLKRKEVDEPLFRVALDHPRFAKDVNAMETLIKNVPKHAQDPRSGIVITTQTEKALTDKIFSDPFWSKSPSTIGLLAKSYPHSSTVLDSILAHPDLEQHQEWLVPALKFGSRSTDFRMMQELSKPEKQTHANLLKILIRYGSLRDKDAKNLLALPHWKNHPELIQFCGGYAPTLKCLQRGEPAPSLSACVLGSIKRIFGK
jgi:hypothetical protein